MIVRRKKLYQRDRWEKHCNRGGLDSDGLFKVIEKLPWGMVYIRDMDQKWDIDRFEVIQE